MKRGYWAALIALALLTVLSLALNGILVFEFLEVRRSAHRIVVDTRSLVTDFAQDTFTYTVNVDQEIPVSTEIALNEAFSVPINTVVPLSTTVVVPVDLRLATYKLAVPIQAVFPVSTQVTVPFSEVIDVATIVPLDVDVPIEVTVADTPLAGYLEVVSDTLKQTEEDLERPIWER